MPPIHSNASHRHVSDSGTIFAPAARQTQVSDEPTTPTTGHIQDDDSSAGLTSDQEGTDNPATVPSISQHEDCSDETMEEPYLVEPDQRAFQPIFTGRLIWSTKCSDKPITPFEELPIPKSDCAKARQQLQAKGIQAPDCVVNFPCGTGLNRFVEITVTCDHLASLSEVSLVFNQTSLQCVLIGLALPRNSLALEILNVPQANTPTATACYVAQSLKDYVQVHDVWICQISYPNDSTPLADTNVFIALISTSVGDEGGLDPVRLHAIPGYVRILTNDCELNYVGRLQWCPACKSKAKTFHTFEDCPSRLCHKCQHSRHIAAACPNASSDAGNATAATQQAEENARGALTLDYGA